MLPHRHRKLVLPVLARLHVVLNLHIAKPKVSLQTRLQYRVRRRFRRFGTKLRHPRIFNHDFVKHGQIAPVSGIRRLLLGRGGPGSVLRVLFAVFAGDFVLHVGDQDLQRFPSGFAFGLLFARSVTGAVLELVDRNRGRVRGGGVLQLFELVAGLLAQRVLNVLVQNAHITLAVWVHDPLFLWTGVGVAFFALRVQHRKRNQLRPVRQRRSLKVLQVLPMFGELPPGGPRFKPHHTDRLKPEQLLAVLLEGVGRQRLCLQILVHRFDFGSDLQWQHFGVCLRFRLRRCAGDHFAQLRIVHLLFLASAGGGIAARLGFGFGGRSVRFDFLAQFVLLFERFPVVEARDGAERDLVFLQERMVSGWSECGTGWRLNLEFYV